MITVALLLTTAAFKPPTVTVALAKLVPVIVIVVPPATGPLDGLTLATVGAATYVNCVAAVTGPLAVVTTTFCAPDPAGVVAVMVVALLVNTVALSPPTVTAAPVKFVPTIVIVVPPAAGPLDGLTLAIVAAVLPVYVNAAVAVAEPPAVVTTTFCAPDPEGVVAVSVVEFTTVKPVAATPPMVTLLAPVKLVPTIVNEVPPSAGPVFGLTLAIVGA